MNTLTAILAGCHADFAFKQAGKILRIVKAQAIGNARHDVIATQ